MNAFYEGMITDARQLVTMWDPFKMGIPMFLFGFIWCLIGYKIQPQKGRAILSTTKKTTDRRSLLLPRLLFQKEMRPSFISASVAP